MFRQWANEMSVAEEISFPGMSLRRKPGSRTEVIASVKLLLCFTVLHHLHAISLDMGYDRAYSYKNS